MHLDGYNQLDYLKSGGEGPWKRKEIYYFTDVGDFSAIRHGHYKVMFSAQDHEGFDVWKKPFTARGWPDLINLRSDPFETGPRETIGWGSWSAHRMFALSAATVLATDFLKTFLDYPPRQKPGSFSVDAILEQLEQSRARMGR